MGFVLNVDLETSAGPSHEVYVRVESLTYNKVTSMVQFQITYWQDRDHAIRFNRTTLDEPRRNAVGLVQERVLYFEDENSDGIEILFPHHLKVPLATKREVDVPEYGIVSVEKEVPYVSFDENGDEITKYRKVVTEEKKLIGKEKKEVEVIDTSLLSNIMDFCYGKIKEMLATHIPEDKIITVK
jgi:hypothetical protein